MCNKVLIVKRLNYRFHVTDTTVANSTELYNIDFDLDISSCVLGSYVIF